MARVIGSNVLRKPQMFKDEVQMYVYDSLHDDGRMLSEIINTEHVNVKNLPGYVIPENVVSLLYFHFHTRSVSNNSKAPFIIYTAGGGR
jgi:hypothetical protein